MRTSSFLLRKPPTNTRRQNEYNTPVIPFAPVHPLELRNRVPNQRESMKDRPCTTQLAVLLQCFKDFDHSQTRCAEHIKSYYKCVEEFEAEKAAKLKIRSSGITTVSQNKRALTSTEINRILKKFSST